MPLAPTDPDDVRHNAWWRFSASENRRFAMANFVTGAVCAQNARSEGGPYLRRPSPRFALHLVDQLEYLLLLAFQEMDDVLAAQTL